MNFFSFPKPKIFNKTKLQRSCLIEEKIDGWRLVLWKNHAYGIKQDSLGRWINKWDKLPLHIQDSATEFPIDGEIYVPGKEASDVSTGLKHRSEDLKFIGFRLVLEELEPLEHIHTLEDLEIPTPRLLVALDSFSLYHSLAEISEQILIKKAKTEKLEGWILKERYKIPTWWKVKVVDTYDLIVTSLTWPLSGRNKIQGWIKSLGCSAYVAGELKEVANVSGMVDKVRCQVTEKDIGRVIEVKANLLASKGRLRHPRFIRWRDDKDAKNCTL